jgi:hypothetical protein
MNIYDLADLIESYRKQFGDIHTFGLINTDAARDRMGERITRALDEGKPIDFKREFGIDFRKAGGRRPTLIL